MNKARVLELFRMLAKSQGLYGRLLRVLESLTEEEQNNYFEQFKNCKDEVDVILIVEG